VLLPARLRAVNTIVAESAQSETAAVLPPNAEAIVVLLVDDQPMIAEAIRRMLSSEPDLSFHYCTDPAGAVAAARRIGPTVILQDLVMPGMNGLTLLRQYRADPLTKDIPVIVLSSKEDPAVKSEAFAAGASDYLVKLPDQIELVARLRLHSRARVNQLQRDEAYRALRVQAMHDSLSGLLNRAAFFDLFLKEVARAARHHTSLAVIMVDVDHFKDINDRYGHPTGDVVLREVSRRLRASLRASDVIGRYGGEEFVVAAPDCGMADATVLAERFRLSACERPIEVPGGHLAVTMSVGVAVTTDMREPEALLRAADEALYRAKRGGRNQVAV
jgi:two-component system chemotaxis family response regulator WspR